MDVDHFGISRIQEHLYLSSYKAALNYNVLKKLGITHILVVASELSQCHEYVTDFEIMYIDLDDDPTENIACHFEDCNTFIGDIDDTAHTTLVHCMAGISRSASIVMAYLMKEYGMTCASAFKLCKEKRSIIRPNRGFRKQLQEYETRLFYDL